MKRSMEYSMEELMEDAQSFDGSVAMEHGLEHSELVPPATQGMCADSVWRHRSLPAMLFNILLITSHS